MNKPGSFHSVDVLSVWKFTDIDILWGGFSSQNEKKKP